jgi:N-acetylmuramoyl-L-alanine amidase
MPLVYIDPGHGTPGECGTAGLGRIEQDDNLKMALVLNDLFIAQGWRTMLARVDNNGPKIAQRTAAANETDADLYINLHRNGFPDDDAEGAEIYLHTAAALREDYKAWAADILKQYEVLGYKNRGVKFGHADPRFDNYGVNRDTNMPSMLIETGFLSNPKDNAIYDENLPELCDAIVQACCRFLKQPYTAPVVPQIPAEKVLTLSLSSLKADGYTQVNITL